MRRVALFCTNFLPYSQTFVHEQLRQHRRYRAEVFCWRRMNGDRFPWEPVHRANSAFVATRRSRGFDRLFRDRRYDVVHAHFGPGGTYARPFARRHGVPLVVTFHGYDVPLLSSRERFLPLNLPYALSGPRLLREMTLGLCCSVELREMLLALGVPPHRLRVHRLGIDLEHFGPSERDPASFEAIMIGRFVEKKGFEYGVRAFARATEGVDGDARLTIVGDGERGQALRTLAQDLGVSERVTFAGSLPKAEVARLLSRADVLLAPSVIAADGNRESGLIVVKEASACHAVPVGTIHGGIPEIIDDGQTGYLVPERDVEAMADRIRRLRSDPDLRRRMGDAGRQKMEREYDNRERVAALEGIYDEVVAAAQGHDPVTPRG